MTARATITHHSSFTVFKHRSFALIWMGRFISTAGSGLTLLAATILVYQYTHNPLSIGLLAIATAAPSLIVGLIAGVYVDHFNRRTLMIGADLTRTVLAFLIPLFVLGAPFHLALGGIIWLYVLTILAQIATQFFEPALESILPDLATEEELSAANAFMQISDFGANGIGFALAGLIAAFYPIQWAFYLDGLTFLFSAFCLFLATIPPNAVVGESAGLDMVFRNLRDGLGFVVHTSALRSLLIVLFFMSLGIGLWNVLLLPFMTTVVHAGSLGFGIEEAVTIIGFVIGSFLLAGVAQRVQASQLYAVGALGMGVTMALIAGTTSLTLVIAWGIVSSFFNAITALTRRLIIQRTTPRDARGRVSSTFLVTINVVAIVGMAGAGLANLIDVRLLLLGVAALCGLGAAGAVLLPGLRQSSVEWRHAIALLRSANAAPGLSNGRLAMLAEVDSLVGLAPVLGRLDARGRQLLVSTGRIYDVAPETTVIRQGEESTAAYFILDGGVAVGLSGAGEDNDRPVAMLTSGDFFGEIAALNGTRRTANVVAPQETHLFEVPATTLQDLMRYQEIARAFTDTVSRRLAELHQLSLPQRGVSPAALRALRAGRAPATTPLPVTSLGTDGATAGS